GKLISDFESPPGECVNDRRHDWDAEPILASDGELQCALPCASVVCVATLGQECPPVECGDLLRGDGTGDVTEFIGDGTPAHPGAAGSLAPPPPAPPRPAPADNRDPAAPPPHLLQRLARPLCTPKPPLPAKRPARPRRARPRAGPARPPQRLRRPPRAPLP